MLLLHVAFVLFAEGSPMLTDSSELGRMQQIMAYSQGSAKVLGNVVYHTLDFTRISFVLSALTGRWLFQLFLALNHHNMAPSTRVMQAWLGWPVFGFAFLLSAISKGVNHYYRDDYPAVQDYLFSLFSSGVLYFILDLASEKGPFESLPMGWFIATTVLVPIVSAIVCKLVIPDSEGHVIRPEEFKLDPQDEQVESEDFTVIQSTKEPTFPVYKNASSVMNWLNVPAGVSFSSAIAILMWVVGREKNGATIGLEIWQIALVGVYALIAGTAGYFANSYPRAFHAFIATSKAVRDSAYSYAGFSGLAFLALFHANQCKDVPCWSEDVNMHLTSAMIPASIVIGLFSALTTLFRYASNYQKNEELIGNIKWAKSFFSSEKPEENSDKGLVNEDSPLLNFVNE